MTTLREAAQQALEALEAYGSHVPNCDHLVLLTSLPPQRKPCSCGLRANITALRAALAQQAEAVAAERERCAEYLMQQAAECRENSPTRVTLESCAAVLRLGLHAQAEPVQEICPGCEATLGAACGRESCPKGWGAAPPQQAEPC